MSRIISPIVQVLMTKLQDTRRSSFNRLKVSDDTNRIASRLMDVKPDGRCCDCGSLVFRFGDSSISCVTCYYQETM